MCSVSTYVDHRTRCTNFPGLDLIKEIKVNIGGYVKTFSRTDLAYFCERAGCWSDGVSEHDYLQPLHTMYPDLMRTSPPHIIEHDDDADARHRQRIGGWSFMFDPSDIEQYSVKIYLRSSHVDFSSLHPTALKKMTSRADNNLNAMNCVLGIDSDIVHTCARCYRNVYDGDCLTICVSCAHDLSCGRVRNYIMKNAQIGNEYHRRSAAVQMQPIGDRKKCQTCNDGTTRVYRRKCKCGNGVNDAIVCTEVHSRCRKCRYVHWRSNGCSPDVANVYASVGMLMLLPIDILNMLRKYVAAK